MLQTPNDQADIAMALAKIDAILNREENLCRALGLLPERYDGGVSDHEEFFDSKEALQCGEDDPRGGLIDGSSGKPILPRVCFAINATIEEIRRSFDQDRPIGERLRLRFAVACRQELKLLRAELVREAADHRRT